MPRSLAHPRDPSILLRVSKRPFADWQLRVNGASQEEDDEGQFIVRLSDGGRSVVTIEGRRFDPLPVLIIDGDAHPLGRDLGGAGIVGVILPLLAALGGILAGIFGMIGAVAVLYASRYGLPAVLRVALGGVCLLGAIGATSALQHLVMTPDTAARDAVARIAEAPQLPPLPVGSDPVAPISLSAMLTLRGQIRRGEFAAADSTLRQLKADARGDVRRETPWRTMYEMGSLAQGPAFAAALDRWVATAAPDDAIPFTVRAWYRFRTGDAIATDAGVGMTQEVYREYVQANADAARDATDALRRDADDLPAFWVLQLLAREEVDRDASRAILARALRRSPTSFESYALTMRAMYPNVRGSLREMHEIADRAAAEVPHNPHLAALARFAAWTQLDDRVENPTEQDIQGLRDLVAVDPEPLFVHSLGHALWHGGHPEEAIVMLDSAIALDPLFVNAYVTRRKYYYALGDDSAHTADSLTVVAIDPQMPY